MIPSPGVQAPLLPPGKLLLKYLFTAQLADGSIYEQTIEDESPFTPGKNAFYELLECGTDTEPRLQGGRVITRSDILLFQLENVEHRYLVDLRDGHFEIQNLRDGQLTGAHFWLDFPPNGAQLKLFYFKRRRHHIRVAGTVQEDLSVKANAALELSQECEYHFGWETLNGAHKAELILV